MRQACKWRRCRCWTIHQQVRTYHVCVGELRRTPARDWFSDILVERHENDEEDEENWSESTVKSIDDVIVAPEL